MDAGLVVDTFAELADTLASGYDATDFLHTLVDRCVETFEVDAAGVFLTSDEELQLAAATDTTMELLQQYENDHDEGPCRDAFRIGQAVVEEDLDSARERWPGFAPKAVVAGFRAGYAFPLRLRDDVIGALNLYRTERGTLDRIESRVAQGYADVATIGILHERQADAFKHRADELQEALHSRIVIEEAKGILIQRHGTSPQAAFEALRSYARSNRRKLRDVCQEVIDGAVPNTLQPPQSASRKR